MTDNKDYGIPDEDVTKIRENGDLSNKLILKLHDKIDVVNENVNKNTTEIRIGKFEREELFCKVEEISKTQNNCSFLKLSGGFSEASKIAKGTKVLIALILVIVGGVVGYIAKFF